MLYKLTFALNVILRGCPHLLPRNQCLGTGTKWFSLRSHLEYPKYLDVNIVTPSPQSDAILKHELSSGLLQKWQKQCAHKDPLPTLVTLFSCT